IAEGTAPMDGIDGKTASADAHLFRPTTVEESWAIAQAMLTRSAQDLGYRDIVADLKSNSIYRFTGSNSYLLSRMDGPPQDAHCGSSFAPAARSISSTRGRTFWWFIASDSGLVPSGARAFTFAPAAIKSSTIFW